MIGLRIAFFGSSLVSAYWNGAATYYRGIVSGLASRGHRVTFYEPDAYDRQKNRDIADPEWARVVVYRPAEADALRSLESARNADILIKTSGVGVFDELLERAVLDVRSPRTTTIFWDVDAPATLRRVTTNPEDPFRTLIARYDLILTYGGGDPVVDAYLKLGARACFPIYNALDPTTHYPVDPDPRFAADLGLVANRLPDREHRVEEFFLHAAERAPERKFVLGGSGWPGKPMPPNVRYLGHVFTGDHNRFNSSTGAVLNINRQSMASWGFSPPTRIFEAAGAMACIITDAWEGIDQFLEPEREVFVATNGTAVAEILRSLTPARSREIGRAAYRRVLAEHTYEHRINQLQEILDLDRKESSRRKGAPQVKYA